MERKRNKILFRMERRKIRKIENHKLRHVENGKSYSKIYR
jgi:hypothetical protein